MQGNQIDYKVQVRGNLFKNGAPRLYDIANHGISIAKYREAEGLQSFVVTLSLLIADMQTSFNTPRQMNENQIMDLAISIIDDNPNLKVEDLICFFEMAKAGKFSKAYGTIDAHLVNEWLFEYKQMRTEELEQQRIIEHSKLKTIKSEPLTEYQANQWDIIKQKLIADREEMERESIAREKAERDRLNQERLQLLEYDKNITKQLKNGQYDESEDSV